jgi:hypothetical protein
MAVGCGGVSEGEAVVRMRDRNRKLEIVVEISCYEAWREISEMIDGTLDPEMQQRMELHLEHCKHCEAVYDGARNVVRLIGDDEVFEMPVGLSERLFKRLSAELCGGR